MKQVIGEYIDDSISYKYYVNNRNEFLGLFIRYYSVGGIIHKTNYFNDVQYGLQTWYNSDREIDTQIYYL